MKKQIIIDYEEYLEMQRKIESLFVVIDLICNISDVNTQSIIKNELVELDLRKEIK